jgi:hypothetical protein
MGMRVYGVSRSGKRRKDNMMFEKTRDIINGDLVAYNAFGDDDDIVEDNCFTQALAELNEAEKTITALTEMANRNSRKIADLKHALGHTEAALDSFGDGTLGELRSKLQELQAENLKLKQQLNAECLGNQTLDSGLQAENERLKFIQNNIAFIASTALTYNRKVAQKIITDKGLSMQDQFDWANYSQKLFECVRIELKGGE